MRLLIHGLILTIMAFTCAVAEEPPPFRIEDEPIWALGGAVRSATIPFESEDSSVGTYLPIVYYDAGGTFYVRDTEGGLTFWKPGQWRFSAMGRLRFLDVPRDLQNEIQGDTFMWGVQGRYAPAGPWHLDLEVLSDFKGHQLANARVGGTWKTSRVFSQVYAQAQYKPAKFNSYYFGLNQEAVGAGVELGVGASFHVNLISNLYFFARGEASFLDKPVRDVSFVDNDMTFQGFLGGGFKNDPTRTTPSVWHGKPYVRLAQGWVTPSSLGEILSGHAVPDPDNHLLTTIFYGYPLSDSLFGLPIQVYLHSGFGWYWKNSTPAVQEFVTSLKLYLPIPWPIRWKLGGGDGWSWVTDVPYVERQDIEAKGYKPSKLMNHLDLSVDLNLGDIFGGKTLKKTWLGYGIHHRSAVYESSQQFGRIKGGSNVQTLYLQYDL